MTASSALCRLKPKCPPPAPGDQISAETIARARGRVSLSHRRHLFTLNGAATNHRVRVTTRMGNTKDSASDNIGFREFGPCTPHAGGGAPHEVIGFCTMCHTSQRCELDGFGVVVLRQPT